MDACTRRGNPGWTHAFMVSGLVSKANISRTVRKPRPQVRQPDNNRELDHPARYDIVFHRRRLQMAE